MNLSGLAAKYVAAAPRLPTSAAASFRPVPILPNIFRVLDGAAGAGAGAGAAAAAAAAAAVAAFSSTLTAAVFALLAFSIKREYSGWSLPKRAA